MNYSSKKNNKILLFCISNKSSDSVKGFFQYSSDSGNYISSDFTDKDEWSVMKRICFTANREIAKCYGENIEELVSEIWNKFFDSKKMKTPFEGNNQNNTKLVPHHIYG